MGGRVSSNTVIESAPLTANGLFVSITGEHAITITDTPSDVSITLAIGGQRPPSLDAAWAVTTRESSAGRTAKSQDA